MVSRDTFRLTMRVLYDKSPRIPHAVSEKESLFTSKVLDIYHMEAEKLVPRYFIEPLKSYFNVSIRVFSVNITKISREQEKIITWHTAKESLYFQDSTIIISKINTKVSCGCDEI